MDRALATGERSAHAWLETENKSVNCVSPPETDPGFGLGKATLPVARSSNFLGGGVLGGGC